MHNVNFDSVEKKESPPVSGLTDPRRGDIAIPHSMDQVSFSQREKKICRRMSKKKERFIKLKASDETDFLMEHHPNAFMLLCYIALRARRIPGHPDGLEIGQAHIGDYWKAGIESESKYRTAKRILSERSHLKIDETCRTRKKVTTAKTTGMTTRGTLVTLLRSDIWDININSNDDRDDDRDDERMTTGSRPDDDEQDVVVVANNNTLSKQHTTTPMLTPDVCEFLEKCKEKELPFRDEFLVKQANKYGIPYLRKKINLYYKTFAKGKAECGNPEGWIASACKNNY